MATGKGRSPFCHPAAERSLSAAAALRSRAACSSLDSWSKSIVTFPPLFKPACWIAAFKFGSFAAWLGLTPKANSSSGKERQSGISKQGDGYIRRLLVVGATAVMRLARSENASRRWASKLLERKPAKLAAVAPVNKTARIAWVVPAGGSREPPDFG